MRLSDARIFAVHDGNGSSDRGEFDETGASAVRALFDLHADHAGRCVG